MGIKNHPSRHGKVMKCGMMIKKCWCVLWSYSLISHCLAAPPHKYLFLCNWRDALWFGALSVSIYREDSFCLKLVQDVAIYCCCLWLLFKSNLKYCNSSMSHFRELHSLTVVSSFLFQSPSLMKEPSECCPCCISPTCHQYVVFNKKIMGWTQLQCHTHFVMLTL